MSEVIPEKFEDVLKYLDIVASAPSPEATPYASLYRVIEILQKLLTTDLSDAETAIAQYRLGATYLQVEEPHNAQTALEKAGTFFYPNLLKFAMEHGREEKKFTSKEIEKYLRELPSVQPTPEMKKYKYQVMDMLNQSGILWFNRTVPLRALFFFNACSKYFESLQEEVTFEKEEELIELESLCTHAHFYLAQVYGCFEMLVESSRYCLSTLEKQLHAKTGFDRKEWVKNCLRLVEYYVDALSIKEASTCLRVCEGVLAEWDVSQSDEEAKSTKKQLQAQLHLAWLNVHLFTLNMTVIRREDPVQYEKKMKLVEENSDLSQVQKILENVSSSSNIIVKSAHDFIDPRKVVDFENARDVFKLANSSAEIAKEHFQLDGFVTQHVRILLKQSLLYKRLVTFENDRKRQIAMHLRRVQLLSSLLNELNPQVYGFLLQELHFECGETYTALHELKQEKGKENNSYALKAISCYQNYLLLYFTAEDSSQTSIKGGTQATMPPNSSTMGEDEFRLFLQGYFYLARICSKVCFASEVERTVAFWKQSVEYHEAVLSLAKRYEQQFMQSQKADKNCATVSKARPLASYQSELAICAEMVELLPEKINQFFYHGKVL